MSVRGPWYVAVAAIFLILPQTLQAQTTTSYPGKLTTIHTFSATPTIADAYKPVGGLVVGDDGNLYGTTGLGGPPGVSLGTVFRITPMGDLQVLHSFRGGTDGGFPETTMVKGMDGNFYGTTKGYTGGATAYRVTPGGVFTSFGHLPDLSVPNSLVAARDGNLYGTTLQGFFKLTPEGDMTLLHLFDEATEGARPTPVVEGQDGAFYGMTFRGGPGAYSYAGTIFRITAEGKVNVLVAFPTPVKNADGSDDQLLYPTAGLVLGSDGNFYGAILSGGQGSGFFRMTPSGALTRLVQFYAPNEPLGPTYSAPIQASDGNFYGVSWERGFNFSDGTVYQVTPAGKLTVIFRFPLDAPTNTVPQGGSPSGLVEGPDGALYGTTQYNGGPDKRGTSGTVFRLATGSGGGTQPSPTPSGTLSNLVAFDPNTDSLRGILPLFNVQTGPRWNPDSSYPALAVQQPNAAGLAADGLTPLVLRVQVPQSDSKVTFSITDSTPDSACAGQPVCDNGPELVGALCAIDIPVCDPGGPSRLTAVAAQQIAGKATTDTSDDVYMAFAVLQAPLDFVRPSHKQLDEALTARVITVTATLDGAAQKQTFELKLARPPVVLLHGIWSNAATWDWAIQHDQRFTVYAEDYSTQFPNNNAAHFSANLDKPQEGIAQAVSLLRDKHIAATRADLVGHSMGGLLARLYAAEAHAPGLPTPAAYNRADNLQMGDIHKLITLDTPHLGSELAKGLFFGDFAITPLGELVNKWVGCVTCGAAADLQAGNEIVTNIPESKIPSHAIVGIGGETILDQIDLYALLVGTLGGPAEGIAEVIETGTSYDSAVFGGDMHDLIVSETSQRGGLSGDAISRFEAQQNLAECLVDKVAGLPFSDCWLAAHFTVTKENRISARVIDLLNAPANSPSFGRFPATSTLVAH